jgi:cell division septation protein DedD
LPKNDDGEFELILGNRQLISVFLIVVILLGVFFSMGYIVGRNSNAAEVARNDKPEGQTADASASDNNSSDSAPPSDEPAAPSATTGAPSANESAAAQPPPEVTKPELRKPEQPASAPPKLAPAPTKASKPKPAPVPERTAERAAVTGQPAGGQYWQVVATSRPDAEIIAEALGKKGFHAVLSPAPKEGIFRVLVGPLADASTLAQTRTGLEAAGFKNPIMRKY